MINVRVRPTDTPNDIARRILDQLRAHVERVLRLAAPSIRNRIQGICTSLIEGREEYQSLLGGQLLGELGIPDVSARLSHILQSIRDSVEVHVVPVSIIGNQLSGGMNISVGTDNFANILSLPDSTYVTTKGTTIPWLEWLLSMGDRIIVVGYDVDFDLSPQEKSRSRTGLALMEKGQGWRLPVSLGPYLLDDNFITRAFDASQVENLIAEIVMEEIQDRL